MGNGDQIVEREIEIELKSWTTIKAEADLVDDVKGVRDHAGKILMDYSNDQLLEKDNVESKITECDNLDQLKEEIL